MHKKNILGQRPISNAASRDFPRHAKKIFNLTRLGQGPFTHSTAFSGPYIHGTTQRSNHHYPSSIFRDHGMEHFQQQQAHSHAPSTSMATDQSPSSSKGKTQSWSSYSVGYNSSTCNTPWQVPQADLRNRWLASQQGKNSVPQNSAFAVSSQSPNQGFEAGVFPAWEQASFVDNADCSTGQSRSTTIRNHGGQDRSDELFNMNFAYQDLQSANSAPQGASAFPVFAAYNLPFQNSFSSENSFPFQNSIARAFAPRMATFQPPNAGQLFGEHNIPSRSYHTSFPHHQSSSLPVQSLETAGPSNHVQGSHEVASQCENMDNHPTQELWNHLNSTAIPKTPSKTSKKKYVPPSKAKKFTKDPEKARKAPEPVAQYLLRARRPMQNAQQPKTLLIVLDLNGTLLERMWGSNRVIMRPYIDSFLKYCFGNHRVMIWSSAQPANVRNMCVKVFNAADRAMLVAMWGRDKLDLSSEDYADRVQVFKRLEKIWEDQELQREHPQAGSGGSWNQTNTVLIDDSVFKAASQPHNLIEIPEFLKEHMRKELKGKILEQVTAYLETARKYEDVSTFIEKNPFRMGESTLLKASGSSTGQLPDKKT